MNWKELPKEFLLQLAIHSPFGGFSTWQKEHMEARDGTCQIVGCTGNTDSKHHIIPECIASMNLEDDFQYQHVSDPNVKYYQNLWRHIGALYPEVNGALQHAMNRRIHSERNGISLCFTHHKDFHERKSHGALYLVPLEEHPERPRSLNLQDTNLLFFTFAYESAFELGLDTTPIEDYYQQIQQSS